MKHGSFEVVGLSPLERPDASLVAALAKSGARAVLDLGRDPVARAAALAELARRGRPFGARIPAGVTVDPRDLPAAVTFLIVPAGTDLAPLSDRELWVEVTCAAEARAAEAAGADGIVARGHEAGGRVGDETSFVLLQRLVAEIDLPIWVYGGIGLHTAAACAAGGAAGVVLDTQLALARESTLAPELRRAIAAADGSETRVVDGVRFYTRPDLPAARVADTATAAELLPRLGGRDLRADLLPLGQDLSFAKLLADRFATAGGICAAIRRAVDDHLALAREHRPCAAGSPLARAHGTEFPIVQGPMTRVSDRAAFADAVADAGGLPFLALALLRGEQVRELLRETAARLGDRPWGAGILGFAPPELREAQLAALLEVPPPFAIIAGGRPSQAAPLEAKGTQVYLHVPSPGLLAMFVKEGARKLIFEGRECGGHVGPRSSFALWEAQIEQLLATDCVGELQLLFAGGIHDGRSAAMVEAMAAPLCARGAKVGVLMGTAYLFTKEAVASGAIKPGFQDQALRCERTVLLETAPGHATRCVETAYVEAFRAEKARLEAQGLDAKQVWAELEQLNLGRLRIASKGVRRDGRELVPVDDAEQAREGMYMIGQVASLRGGVCTMRELHASVGDGGAEHLPELDAGDADTPEPPQVDVAIIGMACIFPGAPDLASFWANIVAGRNAITEVPRERWNPELYYDPQATGASAGEKTPSKWGGFLPATALNPLDYGIPPRSFGAIEPVQLLSLEVARRALADAGYERRELDRARASVIFGAEAGTEMSGAYGFRAMYPQVCGPMSDELHDALPTLTEDSFPGVLANVIAGRIANRLDLGGVNYTVDAACASSLAAIDLAVKELGSGTSDLVLCGGADLHNSINDYLLFSSVHALSPTGQCHTFDAGADGIVLGEGVACVVLKRLADAERDGDRVYAVIKGIAGSSDGRSLGLTAPRKDGQKRALERAYVRAGVSPAAVGLVEAHGTGTVVGDRTELAALTEVYGAAGARPGSVALGSVKTQIGHTKCAAGMASLIKTALALHYGVRPPTLNLKRPNPAYEPGESPFEFADRARPWIPDARGRHAALSALGFGGTNFHAVLAGYHGDEPPAVGADAWPAELLLVRGASRDEAAARLRQLQTWCEASGPVRLRDLAAALAADTGPVQVAIVAADLADLRAALPDALAFRGDDERVFVADGGAAGQVAFLFPGQGSQRPGMLADLFVAFPRLQRVLAHGPQYLARMFPPQAYTPADDKAQRAALTDTRVAQPTLGMVDLAMHELLGKLGVRAAMYAGHSYGELAALCAAGVFDERELIALSEARAASILDAAGADPGSMAAVSAPAADVEAAIAGIAGVVVANHNAPRQSVISGPSVAIERALEQLKARGLAAKPIQVACAFHSPVVAGARDALARRLAHVPFAEARAQVWANSTAQPYPADADGARARLAEQVALPVRFCDQIERMYEAGARVFVEVGPGRVLTGLVDKILGDKAHVAIACDEPGQPGVPALLRALAKLAACGVRVEPAALFEGRDAVAVDLAAAPPSVPKAAWLVDGHTARPVAGDPPKGAFRPIPEPIKSAAPAAAPQPAAGDDVMAAREQTVVEFLRTMREMVQAQRDVMLGYLGTAPVQLAAPMIAPAPQLAVAPLASAPVSVPAPVAAEPQAEQPVADVLLAIVSDRTGYPTEMLELDLDLEAELSIDSIKRIEILGELRERVGLEPPPGKTDEEVVEQLAALKTLREIIAWLEDNRGGAASAPAPSAEPEPAAAPAPVAVIPLRRYELVVRAAPPPSLNGTTLDKRTFALTDDGRGIAEALAAVLQSHGATVHILAPNEGVGTVDGLIHLGSLAEGAGYDSVKRAFSLARDALLGGADWVFAASPLGGRFGRDRAGSDAHLLGGLAGMIKTLAREWPDARVRVIDVEPTAPAAQLAEHLKTEMLAIDDYVQLGYRDGVRYELVAEPAERAPAAPLALDGDSVVLLTGGARGITARVAVELARRYRCQLELVGRSPLPATDEAADTAAAADAPALRKALVARGLREPAAIEKEVARVLAAREIRATLAAIAAAGGRVRYHACDVRNDAAFGALIDGIYTERGRLDGVVHGAGVLEDKLARDKTDDSFARVFDTKVAGALTIARKVKPDVRFVAMFGSVSGVFGNRGQVDYATANDALDLLARSLARRVSGRVVSVDWGPWGGDDGSGNEGMVSPELRREYERRGIGLIAPDDGVARLVDELAAGAGDCQTVLMCADPEQMSGQARERASTAPSAAIAHYGAEGHRTLDV